MRKMTAITTAMLVLLNIGTILAAAQPDLTKVRTDLDRLNAIRTRIQSLEKSLSGLKVDTKANLWNFASRSGNEMAVQKRSRIGREIAALSQEYSGLADGLLNLRASLQPATTAFLKEPGNAGLMSALDGLAVDEALQTAFISPSEVNSSGWSKDRAGFLGYKAGLQAQKLKDMDILAGQLKAAQKAGQEAGSAVQSKDYDKYLRELGDKQAEGMKSQQAIADFLKK